MTFHEYKNWTWRYPVQEIPYFPPPVPVWILFDYIRFQTPFDGFLCFKVYLTKRGRLFQPHLLTTFPIESFDVMQIKTDSILTYSRSEQLFVIHGYHLGWEFVEWKSLLPKNFSSNLGWNCMRVPFPHAHFGEAPLFYRKYRNKSLCHVSVSHKSWIHPLSRKHIISFLS